MEGIERVGSEWLPGAVRADPDRARRPDRFPSDPPEKKHFARSAFFNEINPSRDLWNNASRYEIADAMKYAAAYRGFILFHILRKQNIS